MCLNQNPQNLRNAYVLEVKQTSQGHQCFLKCKPNVACPGLDSNDCAEGYVGRICGRCATGYYRRNQYCLQCPANAKRTSSGKKIDPFTNIVFAGMVYMITLVIQVTFSRDKNDMSDTLLKIRTGVLIVYAIGIIIGLAVVFDNINVNFSNGVFVYQFFRYRGGVQVANRAAIALLRFQPSCFSLPVNKKCSDLRLALNSIKRGVILTFYTFCCNNYLQNV